MYNNPYMNNNFNLQPMTFYVDDQLYKTYVLQAQKQGCKISELILNFSKKKIQQIFFLMMNTNFDRSRESCKALFTNQC